MDTKITGEQFSDLVEKAKRGDTVLLDQFLKKLYQKGKQSLLSLTKSEMESEEVFAIAVAKFWEKFVVGNTPLPKTNIEGYIYTIAKFLYLDKKRTKSKITIPVDTLLGSDLKVLVTQETQRELLDKEKRAELRKEAMKKAIAKLGKSCQQLFNMILEKSLEKPRVLFALLGLKDARAVTVLRYECTKQLKVKAALELELLLVNR